MSVCFSDNYTAAAAANTAEAASFCARTENSIIIILDTVLVSFFVALRSLLVLLVLPVSAQRPNTTPF